MKKIVDLNDGNLLERGIFPSLADNQTELWKTANNVEFRTKRVKKATGFTAIQVTSSSVRAITQAYVDGIRRIYWAEVSQIFNYEYGVGTPLRIGSGFSDASGKWSLETWGNFLLATNGADPPQVWKNISTEDSMEDLAGLEGVRAERKYKLFKKHREHMMGYFGQQAEWSSESDIELWVPAVDNSAGGQFLRDLDSDIVAACPLGPDYAIYSGDSMVLQRYVGAPYYFGFEPAIKGVGAVSDSAIVSVGNKNFGMSSKGFFVTDGISADYIDNPQINELVIGIPGVVDGLFDQEQASRVVGLHDEQNETVKWWYPGDDGEIHGVSYDYRNGTWTILNQPVTAASEKKVFPAGIIGTATSIGFLEGRDLGAQSMFSEIETFPADAGDREHYKQWDMCRVNFEGEGLEIRFGFLDDPDEAPEWTDWAPLEVENWIQRESIFLKVHLRSTGAGTDWSITGASLHGEVTGLAN